MKYVISTCALLLATVSHAHFDDRKPPATGSVGSGVTGRNEAQGVANLPYARGRTFRSLDEYLACLEQQGAIDLPWWRQVSPGVYEWVRRMPGARPERATRAELMRRYGFTR